MITRHQFSQELADIDREVKETENFSYAYGRLQAFVSFFLQPGQSFPEGTEDSTK